MKNTWISLLRESVIISGTLALALVGGVIYLAVTGEPIPEILAALAGAATGYFFGTGKPQTAVAAIKASQNLKAK